MEENKEPKIQQEEIELEEDFKYITYLVGAIQITAEKDDGQTKREYIEKELLLRGVYPINPVKMEAKKTGQSVENMKEKMTGWIASGNWDLFEEKSKEIWKGSYAITTEGNLVKKLGDIDYVIASDWISFILNEGDKCCGSYGESYGAVEHNVPIYLITKIAKKDLPQSLLQWVIISKGRIFENFTQYLEFIDYEYKLKRKEEKK
jgi:hypothetical protein